MFDFFISSAKLRLWKADLIDQKEVNKHELVINILYRYFTASLHEIENLKHQQHKGTFCRFDDTKTSLICELSSN